MTLERTLPGVNPNILVMLIILLVLLESIKGKSFLYFIRPQQKFEFLKFVLSTNTTAPLSAPQRVIISD